MQIYDLFVTSLCYCHVHSNVMCCVNGSVVERGTACLVIKRYTNLTKNSHLPAINDISR